MIYSPKMTDYKAVREEMRAMMEESRALRDEIRANTAAAIAAADSAAASAAATRSILESARDQYRIFMNISEKGVPMELTPRRPIWM